ncbi:MAG TPA: glycoside hydrolase family 16 protein [Baekduia sp.]
MRARNACCAGALVVFASAICLAGCAARDPSSSASALPPGKPWKLDFHDEFGGGSLNKRVWHTCFSWATTTCSIGSNHELEVYDPAGVTVTRGALRLTARRRAMVGWDGKRYAYTSGMVMTGGREDGQRPGFTFTYGFAEARVRVPKGEGLWPAFWMLPADYASRPEIDIMEILGGSTNVQRMHFHYVGRNGTKVDSGSDWTGPDFAAGWHTFAVAWGPDAIVWYVDGVRRWRFAAASRISREPMYLLLNLAVGGDYPGPPDSSTPFPSSFDVDYVRVWQRG